MDIINLYDNYNSYFKADFKSIFELLSKVANNHKFKIGGTSNDFKKNDSRKL